MHWHNPFIGVVNVSLDELSLCHNDIGKWTRHRDGDSFILTPEILIGEWSQRGNKLDAYILPQPDGFHDIGIRYGNGIEQYISPYGNKEKVQALLNKYSK